MKMLDVIVIGVGAMGSAACWQLARRGARVLGLEQHSIAHDLGSSHGQTRLIRQAYFEHPDYVPLLKRAYEGWDLLGAEHGEPLLHRSGLVLFGAPDSTILAGTVNSAQLHQIPIQLHDEPRLCRELKVFAPTPGFRAVFEPGAGWIAVETAVQAMATAAQRAGAIIHTGERVQSWQPDGDGVLVITDRAEYRAGRAILTQGAWSGPLLAGLGIHLSVHRNTLHWFTADQFHDEAPCFGFDLPQGFFYGFPRLHGEVKVAQHRPGQPVTNPDIVDRSSYPDDAAPVIECVRQVLPHLKPVAQRQAVCLYEMSPDEHFILDRHPRWPQVLIAAGFSGHGFKFAPVVGEVLADLALQGTTSLPAEFLGLKRFGKSDKSR